MAHGVPVDYIYGFLPDDRRAELATIVGGNGAGEHACPSCLTCAHGCLGARSYLQRGPGTAAVKISR
jgi:hypothetical protein